VSIRLRVTYLPTGQTVPAGIAGDVCPKPFSLSAGMRHLAEPIGVPMLLGGPNGTKQQGMAFAASRPRGASG
jgi:hypothetical protein